MIKVMIVEDDPMVAALNRQYVEKVEGFALSGIAENAERAMAFLAETDVDLILLDVHMPGKDGMELLGWIREQKQDLDVILITAASEIAQIQQALRLGAADYLIKPFEFGRFQEALLQYRNHFHKFSRSNRMGQQELDRLLRRKNSVVAELPDIQTVPKGLTKTTLQTINEVILLNRTKTFSTEELAKAVSISRVSVRKYLKFLSEIGYLEENLIYGVGRPIYQYCLNPEGLHRLDPYI